MNDLRMPTLHTNTKGPLITYDTRQVIEQPIRGLSAGGGIGFVKGIGRGLVGVVAKPLSGVAALVSKTTEGVGLV